jgi:hypothetical protein
MTPTISVTPSITSSPSNTPSVTASNTQTPTQTQTPTSTVGTSPTPTKTLTATPTQTATNTPTQTNPECTCFSSATVNVRVAGNITFNDCDGNPTIENFNPGNNQTYGDGTFCIRKDTNGGTAEYTIVRYNGCCSIPPTNTPTPTHTQTPTSSQPRLCAEYQINNNTFFDVNWTGLICDSETSTGGLIPANTIGYTTCIQVGTLGYTGTPIITIDAYC